MTETKRLPPPANLKAYRFNVGDDEWVVFAVPAKGDGAAEALDLPEAQAEVLKLLLGGASNAEIAKKRGTSARTVANQVAALFRRFGVASRYELVARIRPRAGSDGDD